MSRLQFQSLSIFLLLALCLFQTLLISTTAKFEHCDETPSLSCDQPNEAILSLIQRREKNIVLLWDLELYSKLSVTFHAEETVEIVYCRNHQQQQHQGIAVSLYKKKQESETCILPPELSRKHVVYEYGKTSWNQFPVPDEALSFGSLLGIDFKIDVWLNSNVGTFRDENGNLQAEALYAEELNRRRIERESSNYSSCTYMDYEEFRLLNKMEAGFFFDEFVSKNRPVVIRNYLEQLKWKPLFDNTWSIPNLLQNFGREIISARAVPYDKDTMIGVFEGCEDADLWKDESVFLPEFVRAKLESPDKVLVRPAILRMSLGDFINNITSRPSSAVAGTNICMYMEYLNLKDYEFLLPLMEDTGLGRHDYLNFVEDFFPFERTRNLWFGDGFTVGKLHFDAYENFLSMVKGQKEFIMFSPEYSENLYEGHIREARFRYNDSKKALTRTELLESTSMVNSPIDIEKPDFERYPKFKQAVGSAITCVVKEGDVLYVPSFWWHEVKSQPSLEKPRVNLAVNHWFEPFYFKPFPCKKCTLKVNIKVYRDVLLKHLKDDTGEF